MPTSRRQAEAQRRQARQDLDELERQLVDGEIDEATAEALREVYLGEAAEADRVLSLSPEDPPGQEAGIRFFSRRVVGTLAVVGVLAAVLLSAAGFLRIRAPGTPITGGFEGVARSGFDQTAAGQAFDPSAYSDEALEAAVAANADNPQIAGMRIALADRYFTRGEYQKAFPHYQAVLEADPPPSPVLVATALSRLGWIVYDGNGEVDLAIGLFDQALLLSPEDPLATYFKALVVWCGQERPDEAAALLEAVLAGAIDDQARTGVEADLAAARGGRKCG